MLLYTDGLTEVFQGEEEFGEDRLLNLLGQATPHRVPRPRLADSYSLRG